MERFSRVPRVIRIFRNIDRKKVEHVVEHVLGNSVVLGYDVNRLQGAVKTPISRESVTAGVGPGPAVTVPHVTDLMAGAPGLFLPASRRVT